MAHAKRVLGVLLVGAAACASAGSDRENEKVAVVVPRMPVAPPASASAALPASKPAGPRLEPAADPLCSISMSDALGVDLARPLPLRVGDSAPFYYVDKAGRIAVRLASPRSTASASLSGGGEIIGHVKLFDLPLRPRSDDLVDGYLRVKRATLRGDDPGRLDPARLELAIELPHFLKPVKQPVLRLECSELLLGTEIDATAAGDKPVDLRVETPIALRTAPGGPTVATIRLAKRDPLIPDLGPDAYEVERRGADVRIRIEWGDVDVEGWVARKDVAPYRDSSLTMAMLSRLDGGGTGQIALVAEAPLYVRTGSVVVQVGTASPAERACGAEQGAKLDGIDLVHLGPFHLFVLSEESRATAGPEANLFVAPQRGEACVEKIGDE